MAGEPERAGGSADAALPAAAAPLPCQKLSHCENAFLCDSPGHGSARLLAIFRRKLSLLVVGITPTGNRDAGKFAPDATQLPTDRSKSNAQLAHCGPHCLSVTTLQGQFCPNLRWREACGSQTLPHDGQGPPFAHRKIPNLDSCLSRAPGRVGDRSAQSSKSSSSSRGAPAP